MRDANTENGQAPQDDLSLLMLKVQ